MSKNLKISKFSLKKNKDGKLIKGDWQNGASELTNFAIAKYQGSLLTGQQAVVGFIYKNGNYREYYGEREEVFKEAIAKIKEKKNAVKAQALADMFIDEWNKSKPYVPNDFNVKESHLLNDVLKGKDISAPELAKITGTTKQNVYGQLSGDRGVSRETAIKYAEKLGVDPVDLLFPKKSVSVWGKVNTLEEVDLEEPYSPGRIYGIENKNVICPRDIWSPNIKAIIIDAYGSMYHNQVAFYYRDNQTKLEINNKLCVVGAKVKGFFDEELTYYYFGLYENVRGKHFLLNPDPYTEDANKYILKNFNLEFISPIVTTLDQKSIKDATAAQKNIPQSELMISQSEAERKISDIAFEYEMKMIKLKKETEKDKEKFLAEGQKALKEYQKAQAALEAQIADIRGKIAREERLKVERDMVKFLDKLDKEKKRA